MTIARPLKNVEVWKDYKECAEKIREMSELFTINLKLAVKNNLTLSLYEGVELRFRSQEDVDTLAVYSLLKYALKKDNSRYPKQLVIAADFSTGRMDDFLSFASEGVEPERPFVHAGYLSCMAKREMYNSISHLKSGSSIISLIDLIKTGG